MAFTKLLEFIGLYLAKLSKFSASSSSNTFSGLLSSLFFLLFSGIPVTRMTGLL